MANLKSYNAALEKESAPGPARLRCLPSPEFILQVKANSKKALELLEATQELRAVLRRASRPWKSRHTWNLHCFVALKLVSLVARCVLKRWLEYAAGWAL